MSTIDDSAEQWSYAAGTHRSQQPDLRSGFHTTGKQRTPPDYEGRHRAIVEHAFEAASRERDQ